MYVCMYVVMPHMAGLHRGTFDSSDRKSPRVVPPDRGTDSAIGSGAWQ